MALPLIAFGWWGLVGLSAFLASLSIKGLIRLLSEKKILVIGSGRVGKSALIKSLGGKTCPGPTTDPPQRFESFVVERSGEKLYVGEGLDFPGGDGFYNAWMREFLAADFVFYLIDVDRALREKSDSYRRTISIHQRRMQTWFDKAEARKPRKLIVVGTHCDRLPVSQRSDEPRKYLDEFKVALGKHSNRTEIVFGSLKSDSEANELIVKIVKTVKYAMREG